jgi:NAD(P)-dependent dehydrogenase (short-subunit alcohol dehydrogenase family)
MSIFSELEGKCYLVTGASRGIGLAIAAALLDNGASVVAHHSTSSELPQGIRKYGGRVRDVSANLDNMEGVESLLHQVAALEIDGVVNNAGVYQGHSLSETTPEIWEKTINVNLRAPFFIIRGLSQKLSSRHGAVVNISSIMGLVSSAGAYAYQSSKSALIHMTRALAMELAPDVRVNSVAPGFIRTDMNRDGWSDEDFFAYVRKKTPLKRWGEPEDIAGPVLFLLSPLSSFITGQCLLVDGGKGLAND